MLVTAVTSTPSTKRNACKLFTDNVSILGHSGLCQVSYSVNVTDIEQFDNIANAATGRVTVGTYDGVTYQGFNAAVRTPC